jgi:hypothetical protein
MALRKSVAPDRETSPRSPAGGWPARSRMVPDGSNISKAGELRVSRGRSPRTTVLVRRFALYVGIGILIAAGGMFWVVRRSAIQHTVSLATFHTRFIAETVLRDRLRETDFAGPVDPRRMAQLDHLFARDVLVSCASSSTARAGASPTPTTMI